MLKLITYFLPLYVSHLKVLLSVKLDKIYLLFPYAISFQNMTFVHIDIFFNSHSRIFFSLLTLERKEGRERNIGERNIDPFALCMCPNQKSKPQPRLCALTRDRTYDQPSGIRDDATTESPSQGLILFLNCYKSVN